jgi:hypothetical protein
VHDVVGAQAQDVRAAGLALRSRVASLRRADVDGAGLVRTWSMRGTVHLHDPDDLPWLHAVFGARNRERLDDVLAKRGGLDVARGMLDDIVALLEATPMDRAALLAELATRGHGDLGTRAVNVLMPWLASRGLILGLPDGRYRAAEPPGPVDAEAALSTLARRYLAGYGPATAADLASWSGLPVSTARRALATLEGTDTAEDLYALSGALDSSPPATPHALLLAGFDATMLGYRTRELFVSPEHDRRVVRGGGIVRPVLLCGGRAAGTWSLAGTGTRRRVAIEWFGAPAESAELDAEKAAVETYLHGA